MNRTLFALFFLMIFAGGIANAFTVQQAFTGGDAGEGLDLDGNFAYAVDLALDGNDGAPNGGGQTVRDATFTDHGVAGVSISTDGPLNAEGGSASFGDTADDDALETVIGNGGIWTTGQGVEISLDVQANQAYVLQLLHSEGWDAVTPNLRTFDISVEGETVATAFYPNGITGVQPLDFTDGVDPEDFVEAGAVLRHSLIGPADGELNISYLKRDENIEIYGFTLEIVPEPTTLTLLGVAVSGIACGMRRRRR